MSALPDRKRSAPLHDVGGGHYYATITVRDGGYEDMWLIDGDPNTPDKCTPGWEVTPAHEQLGKLSPTLQYLVNMVAGRCCRPTTLGRRCLKRVTKPGDPCHFHAGVRNG
ncbi:hypothetical protein [Mycobacterium sp. NPDC050853]|uniref:hypothetical protein n=1 Tax=Mycobacterium sp. NPDC050853 TaxID=3155160 RepID=UPI0033EAF660